MPLVETDKTRRLWQAIVITLRIAVALQCLGNWRWHAQIGETPLLAWLISPADVSGLGWSEVAGLAAQQTVGWLALAAGLCVVCRPCAAVLGPLTALQLLIAVAMCRTDWGFAPQAAWLRPQVAALFPLATQSARIVTPLALMLLDPWRASRPLSDRRVQAAMNLLLCGTAVTFLAHGIEAWQHHPVFVDLLLITDHRLFGFGLTQSQAVGLLSLIGVVDVFVALACMTRFGSGLLWWMAAWGGMTALSRVTALGVVSSWHAAAIRAPHLAAPLAVVLYWHLVRWKVDSKPGPAP